MTAVSAPPIEKWQDVVPYLLAVDQGWHNLATGMPLELPAISDAVREAFRAAVADPSFTSRVTRYHGVHGDPELREQLAGRYAERFSLPVSGANVLITPGAQAAFHYISELMADRGKKVVLFGPEYPGYLTHRDVAYDMVPAEVVTEGDDEFRYVPPRGALSSDVGAVVVSRPSNPAGNVISDEALAELARECAEVGALLVVDNAYAPVVPGLAFRELGMPWADNVVLVQSFSKAALAGERLGFVIAPEPLIELFGGFQSQVATFPPQLVQLAVLILLRDDRYLELCHRDLRESYRQRHQLIREVLDARLQVPFRLHASDGGQFRWLHLPELETSTSELFHELKDRGVLIAPSAPFYLPHLHGEPHARRSVRIGVTATHTEIEQGLGILAEVVNAGR
ncbi:valine--pyruvate transaminase [Saccharopolyspora sp. WRP15-2]|uniref:Valine--pyruvate transaminase n=1 Tax=Saccharopolyspora oryzae TaxID=2997343 RepID=A0ABT4V0Y5_9PSEU|nr:valine--pyruvate transaminase [Saccharopolyspora oryzae]MDA3627069.1 valine--pyruvate transaminase [Saccharopolyspora oryzae]